MTQPVVYPVIVSLAAILKVDLRIRGKQRQAGVGTLVGGQRPSLLVMDPMHPA
jgi:hypothetical protein